MDNQLQFCTVDEAVEEIRQGRMIIVTDDPGRENEADLIIAAEFATTEAINFMVTHARGLVCAPAFPRDGGRPPAPAHDLRQPGKHVHRLHRLCGCGP